MPNLTDTPDPGSLPPVTRVETSDIALGGNEVNVPNKQFKELALRDRHLYTLLQTYVGVGDTAAQTSFQDFKQAGIAQLAQGRLGNVSGGVTTATSATSIFYTPTNGNIVSLYDTTNTRWDTYTFTERTLSLSGLVANTNYDIFLHNNAGTLTLTAVAWTNGTTRAVAVTRQNGVWVNSVNGRRLLGTIRIDPTAGQCTVNASRVFISNVDNRTTFPFGVGFTGSWTYASASYRAVNSNTTSGQGRFEYVNSFASSISANSVIATNGTGLITVGIGASSTSTPFNQAVWAPNSAHCTGFGVGNLGYGYLQILEAATSGSVTLQAASMGGIIEW